MGNLAGYLYPNGVATGYVYDPLNRLTSMQSTCNTGGSAAAPGCGAPNTPIASYAYTLGLSGNRLAVAELSGRTVTYGYDDLYRLTSESVAGSASQNGVVSYQYDSVGNRLQRNSTLPAIPATGLLNYDANDRTSTDPYDANGNLLNGGVGSNVYDFENHMVAAGGVSLVYDGDGNRVKETVAGVATSYLVADQNLTGYAQVLDELKAGAVSRIYSYGLSMINERQSIGGASTTSFYGFDGHGSVRFLTSSTGAITDTYDYDAFGSVIASTGPTPNNYLFAGEQFDPLLGIYYNRARYYDQRQGRFWSRDTDEGDTESPASLHTYLYARANPVTFGDPSGRSFASTLIFGRYVGGKIGEDFALQTDGCYDQQIANLVKFGSGGPSPCFIPWNVGLARPLGGRPDLADWRTGAVFEIKSGLTPDAVAYAQLAYYLGALYNADPFKRPWHFGRATEYVPPLVIPINAVTFAVVVAKPGGLIQYYVIDPTDAVGAVALSALAGALAGSIPQNVGAVAANANAAAAAEIKQDAIIAELEDAA